MAALLLVLLNIVIWLGALALSGSFVQAFLVGDDRLNEKSPLWFRTSVGAVLVIEGIWLFIGALALTVWLSDVFDWIVVKCGWELIGPAGRLSLLLSFVLGPVIAYFVAKAIFVATLKLANKIA